MQEQMYETLKNHGIELPEDVTEFDPELLFSQLDELEPSELWTIVETVSEGGSIKIDGDEHFQSMALNCAIVNALENDLDYIDQEQLNTAIETVSNMVKTLKSPDDETETDSTPEASEVEKSGTGRTAKKRDLIQELVKENPQAQADEIVTMALESDPSMTQNTAKQYYYNVRKDLGIGVVGKRGRKPSDTMDRVKAILEANSDASKSDTVEKIVAELELKESTASTYYGKARKSLK